MQTLAQSLQDHDRGHLKVIAHLWGLELPNDPRVQVIEGLSNAMLEHTPKILETLPGGARLALDRILENGGRTPMEALVRQFGPIRDMGPVRRDRLMPWKEPESPLEMLWYRGLLAKAFTVAERGPQEYGFVPDDLLAKMPKVSSPEHPPLGEPASPPKNIIHSYVVDDAITILAAHRRCGEVDHLWLQNFLHQPDSLALIKELLREAEIFDSPKQIRDFLQLPRDTAQVLLQDTWQNSTAWNDLAHAPGIHNPTGDWPNDPLAGRQAALRFIRSVPSNTWWSVSGFIDAVYETNPGFMRPPGGFESWYLQSSDDGSSLRGFEAWDAVERKYLEHLITAPMLWLGLTDVSLDRSALYLRGNTDLDPKEGKATAYPDGRIRIAREADRTLRYQLARLCAWDRLDRGAYSYRLTARSLLSAEKQGLTAAHAGKVMSQINAPEGVLKALRRWEQAGMEAEIEQVMVLQVNDPRVMELLLDQPSTRKYIGEPLGPVSVEVDPKQWPKLQEAALRMGLLIGVPTRHGL